MAFRTVVVERYSITAAAPFETVVARIDAALGHPDMRAFLAALGQAPSFAALEAVVAQAVGRSGMMEFVRFDSGAVLAKDRRGASPRMLRLLIGNPVIMKQMAQHVPDAAAYAPVTVLIDERPDGVHLSYDRMASFLAGYGSPDALAVARDLDQKIERLLTAVSA